MLGKLLGMLDKSLDGKRGSKPAAIKLLQTTLASLALVHKALPDAVYRFVLSGDDPAVLIKLGQTPIETAGLLGNPGSPHGYRWINDDAHRAAAEASMHARADLYAANTLEDAQLLRLAKVFATLDRSGSSTAVPGLPRWVGCLLNDYLFGAGQPHWQANKPLGKNGDEVAAKQDVLQFMDFARMHRLLELDGQPGTLALVALLDHRDAPSYYRVRTDTLISSETNDQYLLQHAAEVAALPSRMLADGRFRLSRCLGRLAVVTTFAPTLAYLAVDGSKTVRVEAGKQLEAVPAAQRLTLLGALLRDGAAAEQEQAAELLGRIASAETAPLLQAALETNKSRTVQQAIRNALSRLDAVGGLDQTEVPVAPPYNALPDTQLDHNATEMLLKHFREQLIELKRAADQEAADNREHSREWSWREAAYTQMRKLTDAHVADIVAVLNGAPGQLDREQSQLVAGSGLFDLPEFSFYHFVRWADGSEREILSWFWNFPGFVRWRAAHPEAGEDLRMFADVLERLGKTPDSIANSCLREHWQPLDLQALGSAAVWPFFARYPGYIDEALGLTPNRQQTYREYVPAKAIEVIGAFPQVPARWVPRLLEIALGDSRSNRAEAQQVLARVPGIAHQAIDALGSTRQEVRIVAADWLGDLNCHDAIPALQAALAKENRETVRATLLTTLERLGADIQPLLSAENLQREASKGLKGKLPVGLGWFAFDHLPGCQWASGGAVDASIIKWWVVLAYKLKEPGGNALLDRYLSLLDAASAAALARFILRQFIARDTLHPSLDEAVAHAQANVAARHQMYQGWASWSPAYAAMTREQVFEQLKREKLGEYLGTAIGEKGILGLIGRGTGHEMVATLQPFMRDHYIRRFQIEAILEGLANSADPAVIQLLLAISRRHRTASVQTRARALVERIAQRNHWTQDELADRTIPSAGFDDTGRLVLFYGEREFTVVLDAGMKPVLQNSDGKAIKALPEPRKSDAPDSIKEAKALFAACKKELKQVLELQQARLYEALCTGRVWPAADWLDYLYGHPVMGRLVQQLVWQALDADGQPVTLFRPTEDGSLIDLNDDELDASTLHAVRLAHIALVDAASAKAWRAHLKDYKITPLFAQFAPQRPATWTQDADAIDDRLGWLGDTFSFRGAFAKRGYQRSQAEDGGIFYSYFKEFASSGIRVVIEFSGNTLPEENVPAALKTLMFENTRVRNYRERLLKLDQVPHVLLAEAYADYLAVADVCSGFDAEWDKKTPW